MSDQDKQTKAHVGFLERATALARDAGALAADVASHATGAITEALSPSASDPKKRSPIGTAPHDGKRIRVYDTNGDSYLARWDGLRGAITPVFPIQYWSPADEGDK